MQHRSSSKPRIKGIGRIVLGVRDMDRSRKFYECLLSMDRPTKCEIVRDRRGLCTIEDWHATFGLQLREGFAKSSQPAIEHFCFRTDSEESLRDIHGRATNLGADVTSPQQVNGEWQFFMYDPDGHKIGVYAPITDQCEQVAQELNTNDIA